MNSEQETASYSSSPNNEKTVPKRQQDYRKKVEPKVQQLSNKIEELYKFSLKHEGYEIEDIQKITNFLGKRLKEMETQLKKADKNDSDFSF